jgi:uncharacterized protein
VKQFGVFFLLLGAPLVYGQSAAPPQTLNKDEKSAANAQANSTKPAATIGSAKEAAIRKLFEISGIKESMKSTMAAAMDNIRPTLARSLPPGEYQGKLIDLFIERFQQKVKVDDIVELIIPIYDKYLSMEDVDALTKFYQTPAGKKALATMTQVMVECANVSQRYGEDAGRQAMVEVIAEHPEIQKAIEEAGKKPN